MISKLEYGEFEKHYVWVLLQAPDYRLGQAFLNYFPKISKMMLEQYTAGMKDEFQLFNERDPKKAQEIINQFLFDH